MCRQITCKRLSRVFFIQCGIFMGIYELKKKREDNRSDGEDEGNVEKLVRMEEIKGGRTFRKCDGVLAGNERRVKI